MKAAERTIESRSWRSREARTVVGPRIAALALAAWLSGSGRADSLLPAAESPATDPELRSLLDTKGTIVRYLDGVPLVTVQGPECCAPGVGWSFQLQYLNRVTSEAYGAVTKEDAGFNWKVSTAILRHWPNGDLHLEMGNSAVLFRRDDDRDRWVEIGGWGRTIRLVEEDGYRCHRLDAGTRGQAYFYADGALAQKFHKAVDADGPSWHFLYYGAGDGKFAHKLKSLYVPGPAFFWQFYYYSDSGFLKEIRVCRGATVEDVLEFHYYESLYEGIGSPGDLKEVTRRRWDKDASTWNERSLVFRYYTGSGPRGKYHDLKYVLGPETCDRIRSLYDTRHIELVEDAQIDDPEADEPLALYDAYLEYHRVPGDPELDGRTSLFLLRSRIAELPGSAELTTGPYRYEWEAYGRPGSSAAMPYEDALIRVLEIHPDGSARSLEVNRGGLVTSASKTDPETWRR